MKSEGVASEDRVVLTTENEGNKAPTGYGSLPLEIIVCERGLVAFCRHTEIVGRREGEKGQHS